MPPVVSLAEIRGRESENMNEAQLYTVLTLIQERTEFEERHQLPQN